MKVSFTKIGDDILVPTQLYEAKDPLPLSAYKWFWWGLGGLWLFGAFSGAKFGWQGIALISGIVLIIAASFAFVMRLPFGWIELNRKDGTVTVWTSSKKRRRVATGKFADHRIDWTCYYMQTSKYSAEYRYSLGLYPLKGKKKYHKTLVDGVREVQFCFLCEMATRDTKRLPERGIDKQAEAVTRKAEAFLNDFFAGKPLAQKKNNTYCFSD